MKDGVYPNDETFGFYRKAVEMAPEDAEIRRRVAGALVSLWEKTGEEEILRASVHHYRTAIEMDPPLDLHRKTQRDKSFAIRLAGLYNRPEESAELFNALLDMPHGWNAHQLCRLVGQIDLDLYPSLDEFRRRILKIRARCRHASQMIEAETHEREGRVKEAISSFESLKDDNPYHYEIYLQLPRLYSQMEQTEKARELVKSYFELDVEKADRCDMRAKLLEQGYEALAPELFAQLRLDCIGGRP